MTKIVSKTADIHISIRALKFYLRYGQKMTAEDFIKKLVSDSKWIWNIPSQQDVLAWKSTQGWDNKLKVEKNPQNALEEYEVIKEESATRARHRMDAIDIALSRINALIASVDDSQIPQEQIIKILPQLIASQEKLFEMQQKEIAKIEEAFAKALPDHILDSLTDGNNETI